MSAYGWQPDYTSGPASSLLGVTPTQGMQSLSDAQQRLQQLLAYDPNASIQTNTTSYGGEGGAGGSDTTYSLNFDQSKLPAISPQVQQLLNATHNFDDRYIPQGLQGRSIQDPNYGNVTVPNVDRSTNWLGILGPLLVGGFAGIAGGGLGLLGGAVTKLPNVASMLSGMQQKSRPFNNATGPMGQSSSDPQQALLLQYLARQQQTGQ